MINLALGKLLKNAGLRWVPVDGDRFAIPSKELENEQFIVSGMAVQVEVMSGREMITFNGASEWAMDYITVAEAIWLPSDAQLCAEIQARLVNPYRAQLSLEISPSSCTGVLYQGEIQKKFTSKVLSDVYGQVLLYLLTETKPDEDLKDSHPLSGFDD